MNILKRLTSLFSKSKKNSLSRKDEKLVKKYVEAGAKFGDAVSYLYIGECIGFEDLLNAWAKAEKEYASKGFRTIPIDDFILYGGYGKEIKGVYQLYQLRKPNEEPIYHAEIYRERFLGKTPPSINMDEVFKGNIQSGTQIIPSTKD